MYLKKIELSGFKSFAERTELRFGPGLGVIVGPNGSGKSNIADALRWVLGEQSIKELRGGKLEDVIFAGTEHRKPLSFADVTMRLDNSDKTLPMEFNEITITRRVYRSGESEFLINGESCRLKDIQQLFLDTGIGRDGYSIIGQGRIDEILSQKSEDRRNVFEEAAGIAKYKSRRREAELKLEREKQNRVRLADIISGLCEQLEPLAEESEKAKKYLALRDEYRSVHISLCLEEIEKIETEKQKLEESIKNLQTQSWDTKKELEKTRLAAEEAKNQDAASDEKYKRLSGQLVEITATAEKQQSNVNLLENNIEKWRGETKRLEGEIKNRSEKIAERHKKLLYEAEKKLSHEKELNERNQSLKEHEAHKARQEEKLLDETEASKKLNQAIFDAMNSVAAARLKLNEAENTYAHLEEEKEKLNETAHENEEKLSEQKKCLEVLQSDGKAYEGKIMKEQARVKEIKLFDEDLKLRQTEVDTNMHKTKENLTSAKGRLSALKALELSHEGFNRSVKAVLSKRNSPGFGGICGAVGELFAVDGQYETAIETALGANIQNIVAKTEQDAKHAIEMLKKTREGRATFLPIASLKIGKGKFLSREKLKDEPGYVGVASNLIRHGDEYAPVANFLLGDVAVFRDLDTALKAAKKHRHTLKIVTMDGERLSPGGSITGGFAPKQSIGLMNRGSQIESLTTEVASVQKNLAALERTAQELSSQRQSTASALEETITSLQKDMAEAERNKAQTKACEENIEHITKTLKTLKDNNEKLLAEIGEANKYVRFCRGELAEFEKKHKIAERKYDEYRQCAEKNRMELSEEMDSLADLRVEIMKLTEWIRHGDENIGRIKREINMHEDELKFLENERAVNDSLIHDGCNKLDEEKCRLQELTKQAEEAKKALKESEEEKQEYGKTREAVQSDEYALNERAALLERELARLEMRQENINGNSRRLHDEIWEDYGYTHQSALKHKLDAPTGAELKKRQAELKPQLAEMQDVNIGAIEAYKNIKDKHDFLSAQHNDLMKAEEQLGGIITELTVQMEAQFKERFAQINEHFKAVFSEMFSGGKAGLRLESADNILESGIEITAQPPGKSLKNLTLLSGGERALTAIALLFAILRLKPSPFCVLDEIESALDDANVARFSNFIRQYTDGTQFILISHRKGTMEAADNLYGVTMEEQGVSKLVSVKLT